MEKAQKGIGFYTLGKHRKSLNNNQKNEFKKIFREYFLKSFSTRLVDYKEAKIVVISEEVKNEKYTIVKSKLLATSIGQKLILIGGYIQKILRAP